MAYRLPETSSQIIGSVVRCHRNVAINLKKSRIYLIIFNKVTLRAFGGKTPRECLSNIERLEVLQGSDL